jgi:hypothetical protein
VLDCKLQTCRRVDRVGKQRYLFCDRPDDYGYAVEGDEMVFVVFMKEKGCPDDLLNQILAEENKFGTVYL